MRAAIFRGPRDIEVGERPDPVIREPTDAIVRVLLAGVSADPTCGTTGARARTPSDRSATSSLALWSRPARTLAAVSPGDLVVPPFIYSDMTCPHCQHGSTISCKLGGNFGDGTIDGGQGEAYLAGFRWRAAPWCAFRTLATPIRRSDPCSRCQT